MSARDVWHAQMEAGRLGRWDEVAACFAPSCAWTLMPTGAVFQGRRRIVGLMAGGLDAAAVREAAEPHSEFATDGWGLFEYTSRGPIDAEGAGRFAALIGTSADDSGALAGQRFEVPVCFIYHVDATGQIDEVREYLGRPAITLPLTG